MVKNIELFFGAIVIKLGARKVNGKAENQFSICIKQEVDDTLD